MDLQTLLHTPIFFPLLLGLLFLFSNGFRDSSTIVATVVSTRVLSPTGAFVLCALFEFLGAFFIGSAVAQTVRGTVLNTSSTPSSDDIILVIGSGLVSAIGWGILSWWRAWPTSNNQALIAGLFGSSLAVWGPHHFESGNIYLVVLVLISSPVLGFLVSTLINSLLRRCGAWLTPKVKPISEALHVLACLVVSSAHGSNDTQLLLGVFGALFWASHLTAPISTHFHFVIAVVLSGGVLLGGRRLLKKMGMKFFRIRDTEGLGAQASSALTILMCNYMGFPASTTQVISGSIVGAGFSKNPRGVRWHIVKEIVLSWIVTIPSVAFVSYILSQLFMVYLRG